MNNYPGQFRKTIITASLFFMTVIQLAIGQSKNQEIEELINKYHEYGKFNGSALVAEQGKIVYQKGHGMANMEWDIENSTDTKHRLGSISKQFTAMLILQLAAEGKIDLQAPIDNYIPDYPNGHETPITTHHLLTHTAGVPNYTAFPGFFKNDSRDPYTPDQFLDVFKDKQLDFAPGEKFSYSNSGYFLLGVLIEKVSGKSYETMLHDNIFEPLAMTGSGYDHHKDILKNRATGYEKFGDGFINSNYLDMSIPYAAGSVYSTVEDLYKWDQALYTNKMLSKEHMELYFKPQVNAWGNFSYAYGWGVGYDKIGTSKDSIYTISHGGGINGFNTNISRAPSDKSLVVLLNNTGGAPLNEMTQSIRAILKDKPYELPKKSGAYEVLSVIKTEGIEAGEAHYKKLKEADTHNFNENQMNEIGYLLMGEDKITEALAVFKWNMESYPDSFNTYDSYAEASMKDGNNEDAINYYKKSIEINPGNQNGIDMLKKLGVDTSDLVKKIVVDDAILQSYVGHYELQPGFMITITKEDSQLKAQATGQPVFEIYAKSDTVFYLTVVEAQVEFHQTDGKVDGLTLFQGGQEMVGKRLSEK